ncbi:cupin domain-containing protein [Nocardioides sp. Kera G14]|uniref:cupin domain-containing protein n=1 Tax=Nocardioides sp. Kera G14 TaxID=2884264 RepID=UPI001D0FE573|nr:cupin domain-containing protein [Nocardioides sp. Kera G14]UDY23529.1 cupin domain-containing protein [Nocardioides sp. Kera G14]
MPEPRAVDAFSLALDDLFLEPESVVAGEPTAGVATLHELTGIEVGVWELTPGTVTDTEVDEVFVVIAGAGTVEFRGSGEVVELRPGVVVRLKAGDQTTWTVTETLRKVWVTP